MSAVAESKEIEIVPKSIWVSPERAELLKRDFGLDVKREMIEAALANPLLDIAIQLHHHGIASKDDLVKILEEEFGKHGKTAAHLLKQMDLKVRKED